MDARPHLQVVVNAKDIVLVTGEWTLGRTAAVAGARSGAVLVTGEWTLGRTLYEDIEER